jgi:hypothetical protein
MEQNNLEEGLPKEYTCGYCGLRFSGEKVSCNLEHRIVECNGDIRKCPYTNIKLSYAE